jgi:four helix bundle protein
MSPIKSFRDLEVYHLSHELAMSIYRISIQFPQEEKYSLTDQVRRSSRSVSVNLAEGWGKRAYKKLFKRHIIDALGSLEETVEWILYCFDCEYISGEVRNDLLKKSNEIGAKLYRLNENWN